jgi:hypothetical protein
MWQSKAENTDQRRIKSNRIALGTNTTYSLLRHWTSKASRRELRKTIEVKTHFFASSDDYIFVNIG